MPVLSYASKFSSAFYGRSATPRTRRRSSATGAATKWMERTPRGDARDDLDPAEGADIILMKPALAYLDVIRGVRERFRRPRSRRTRSPANTRCCTQHSRKAGWQPQRAMMESLISIRRAGAGFIVTYFAKDAARVMGSAPCIFRPSGTSLIRKHFYTYRVQ